MSTARTNKSVTTATLRKSVIDAMETLKAKDVREIDVRGKTSIADLLVIASGTSARHVKSIADEVSKFAKKAGLILCGLNRVSTVITDTNASDYAVQLLEQSGVHVVTVAPEALPPSVNPAVFTPSFDFQPAALYHTETSH